MVAESKTTEHQLPQSDREIGCMSFCSLILAVCLVALYCELCDKHKMSEI